ncbi:MAG: kinase [Alphaproteobacteria bacterium]|nr:MAG: kinase [Alphaproteobacteria bacterium]
MSDVTTVPTIIYDVIQRQRALHPDRPVLVGVAGAQGSGKTTACQLLEMANRPRFAHFSLDDVYLTKAERVWRADNVSSFDPYRDMDGNFQVDHKSRPEIERLLLTRGPPGTHDLSLANDVIARLMRGEATKLPRFDKAADDRAREDRWPLFEGPAEAILVDGWCLGAKPTALTAEPLNDVEREDEDSIWRKETETQLRKIYAPFFATFDAIVYLKPPNWEIVRAWRGQQEEQMLGRALTAEEGAKLDRFLMFYERITRSMMAGGHVADVVVALDEGRGVLGRRGD